MEASRRWRAAAGLAAAALAGIVLPAAAATGSVQVKNFAFSPNGIRIDPGDSVRWTNSDNAVHTVTSDAGSGEAFDSGSLGQGKSYSHMFRSAGTFSYHCERHPSTMTGVVQVGPAPTTTTTGPPPTTATTVPPTTTTTVQPPITTTTEPPAAATTEPPATTTTAARAPSSAGGPPTTVTTRGSTTTTAPATTTTAAPTTSTSTSAPAPPPPPPDSGQSVGAGPVSPDPAPEAAAPAPESARGVAERGSGERGAGGGGAGTVLLVISLIAVGGFGLFSLWQWRPGRPGPV